MIRFVSGRIGEDWIVDVFRGDDHLFQEFAASEELALAAARDRLARAEEAASALPATGAMPTVHESTPDLIRHGDWLRAIVTHTGIANPAKVGSGRRARYEIIIAHSGATTAELYRLGRSQPTGQPFNKATLVAALRTGLITVTMPDGTVYSQSNWQVSQQVEDA